MDEVALSGGNVGQVWRRGDRVLRETGPWSPAVHRLLRHLEGRLDHVPRFHGIDEHGREVLDFLPGRIVDVDAEELTDGQLASVVRWVRDLHTATAGFDATGPWRFPGPPGADRIGHNDLAPYNVVFDGDRLAGVFDWDLAGPTTVLDELGFVAFNGVPLFRPAPVDAAARLRLIADTYGGVDPHAVLDATVVRVRRTIDSLLAAAAAGDEGMRRLIADTGAPGPTRVALARLEGRLDELHTQLARRGRPIAWPPA